MPLVRDQAICLRKVEYSETSQILTIFTHSHGLMRVIAKGAHRRTKAGNSKFDGGLDLCDYGEAVYIEQNRDLSTLTEWKLLDGFLQLRTNLRAMYLGQYICEWMSLLFEVADPHNDLFARLLSTITQLNTPSVEEQFLALELDILGASGFMPELSQCVICAKPLTPQTYFSPSRSGAVCKNCEVSTPDRQSIDSRLLRIAHTISTLPRSNGIAMRLPRLTRHQTDPINHLLADHLEQALQKRLVVKPYIL